MARRAAHRFQAGDFGTAATLLREAIALHETPALQINLARTLTRLERWEEARDAYLRYLELEPDGENRASVEQALRELEPNIPEPRVEDTQLLTTPGETGTGTATATATGTATETETAAEQVDVVPPDSRVPETVAEPGRSPAPWIVFGAGLAVVASGIPLTAVSSRAADDARNAANQREAEDPASKAKALAIGADVLYALGGAAAVTGLIWALVGRRDETGPVSVGVHPRGVSLSGRF